MNKILIILTGAPGTGKSTWANKQNVPIINIDEIRRQIVGRWIRDPSNRIKEKAFQLAIDKAVSYYKKVNTVIWDGTNIKAVREKIIESLKPWVNTFIGVVFATSLQECLNRNTSRKGKIGEKIISDRYNLLKKEPPSLEEGFNLIIYI